MPEDTGWPAAPAIYQIYPRSFRDSDGSGTGDLRGITAGLEEVAKLGVDAIWLSPFYRSAWEDGGYDVIDHTAVDPRLGTDADFDALVARAHDLGLKVMIDQVLNHTSCEHPWFRAALDGDDDMAARYLFCDPKPDGTPPNNWLSQFGLPGWTYAFERRQYYFHQFLACQPSLNLRNPQVQEAHRKQIAGWRARGVEGFRFDAVTSYLWDEDLQDNPPADPEVAEKVSGHPASVYTFQDHLHDMLPGDGAAFCEHLRDWAGEDAYLIGEVTSGNQSVELAMEFSRPGRLNAAYTTDLPDGNGRPQTVRDMIDRADLHRLVGWLSSHDQPRHVAAGQDRVASAQVFAAVMALLPGPWLIFQGEDWGLPQPELRKDEVTDPLDLLYWPEGPGREGARVPLPWTETGPAYGFTTGTPWLPMRWDGALADRTEVRDTYATLVEHRRSLGWDRGTVSRCEASEQTLLLEVDTNDARYRGSFVMEGAKNSHDRDAPDADILLSFGGRSWSAVIERLADP